MQEATLLFSWPHSNHLLLFHKNLKAEEKVFLEAELNKYVSVPEEIEDDLVNQENEVYQPESSPETGVDEDN